METGYLLKGPGVGEDVEVVRRRHGDPPVVPFSGTFRGMRGDDYLVEDGDGDTWCLDRDQFRYPA